MNLDTGFIGSAGNSRADAYLILHPESADLPIHPGLLASIFASPLVLILLVWLLLQ